MILCVLFRFRSNHYLQDEGYDSWDAIADYVFNVTPFPMPSLDRLTPSTEELKRQICLDAPQGSGGDTCSRL